MAQPAHRLAGAEITVTDRAGTPLADTAVTVEQVRHRLQFGCNGFEVLPLANGELDDDPDARAAAETLQRRWLDLFDSATLPFYWGRFEPEQGHPDTLRLRSAAAWLSGRGILLKGHPLVWHTVQPDWLLPLPHHDVERLLRERIRREVADFRDLVFSWDTINEAVIMPVFTNGENAITPLAARLGRVGMARLAFEEAREADPTATFLINDFNLSADYERLIEECLEAGLRIDAIGLQSHMHQGFWGEERVHESLERFARFGLPLHFTEITLVSGQLMPPEIVDLNDYQVDEWPTTREGEARQADEAVRLYDTLVSHPAVEAVTWWDFRDGGWLGAPSGLVRRDGTPKPAYDALRARIRGDWWLPPTQFRTDSAGRIVVDGFAGTYRLSVDGRSGLFSLPAPGPLRIAP